VRILFLDIDGVLNSTSFFAKMLAENKPHTSESIDPGAIRILNLIKEKTGCVFVISSSWRLCNQLDWITNHLRLSGFAHRASVLGMTPDISLFDRKAEILEWIRSNRKDKGDSFCALDDNAIHLPYWVEVNPKLGLNDDYYADLVLDCFKRQE
jgi:hypothetical protein